MFQCKVFKIIQSQRPREGIILKEFLEQHLYPTCQLPWWQGDKCFWIWLKQSKSYETVLKRLLDFLMCARGKHSKSGASGHKSHLWHLHSGPGGGHPQPTTVSLHLLIIESPAPGIFFSHFRASEWPWSAIMAIFWALISFFRNELVDISSKIRQCWMGCAVAEFSYFREGIGAQIKNHKRHTSYVDLVYLIHK